MNENRPLGRGLKALFGEDRAGDASVGVRTVPTAMLTPCPLQPRRRFDENALDELARSIREKGVLQPLIVRPGASGVRIPENRKRVPGRSGFAPRRKTRLGPSNLTSLTRGLKHSCQRSQPCCSCHRG